MAFNTPFFGVRDGQEGYGMKMDDFQLHVHLLPCSLINNSNVAFACPLCFSTEAKDTALSITTLKQKILAIESEYEYFKKGPQQCTEPWEIRRLYTKLPHSKEEIEKKMVHKTPHAEISSFQWLLTPLFGLRGCREDYAMKMDDFQLHVHLLPCSLINNSNGALHAVFASALKLKIPHCQSRP